MENSPSQEEDPRPTVGVRVWHFCCGVVEPCIVQDVVTSIPPRRLGLHSPHAQHEGIVIGMR